MINTLIFDLDGTLLDTLTDLYLSVNYALESFNMPLRTKEEVRRFIGNGVRTLIRRAVPTDTDDNTYEKCFSVFSNYYLEHMLDNTKPYNEIIDLLESLKKSGYKIAIVSNKLHKAVVELSHDFFRDLIDLPIGVSAEDERKPSPANVLKVIDGFRCSKEECIYIGDSEVDIQTANNAQMLFVGVSWGYRDKKALIEHGGDIVIEKPMDLLKFLNDMK